MTLINMDAGRSKITDGTTDVSINTDGQMHGVLRGAIDDNNSTSTPLIADAVFTGIATNTLDFGFIFVTVFSDVASATDGFSAQQSMDGTNWDNTDEYTIPAGTGKTYSFQPGAQWFRVVYTNGSSGQASFRLQTLVKKTSSLPSSHRIQDSIIDDDDAELTKAVITGKNPAGTFVNFQATTAGNFKVSGEETESNYWKDYFGEVSLGNITGQSPVNKFGAAPSGVQTTETDIWDRADATPTQSVWLAPTAARIHTIASSSASDDTGGIGIDTVIVSYLADWDTVETTETVTGDLNAGIAMSNAAVMINRMEGVAQATTTTAGGNVGTITATAATDATITAVILPGNGQTEMAIYGWPSTQTALLYSWDGAVDKTTGAVSSIDFILRFNGNPDVQTLAFVRKDDITVQSTGVSSRPKPKKPPVPFSGPGLLKVTGIGSTSDLDAKASFDMILVTN